MNYRLILAAAALVALAACARTAPLYNVSEAPVVASKPASADDVGKAIVIAGTRLGWQMVKSQPGVIMGTLNVREHQAVVEINYTPKTYSITYKNSTNLMYDNETNNIHKNYNGWIQNLDREIRTQLVSL